MIKKYCKVYYKFIKAAQYCKFKNQVGESIVVLVFYIISLDLRHKNKVS